MLKFFLNIFLIIIIAFSASVIPINKDMFNISPDIDLSLPFKDESANIVVSDPQYATDISEKQILNPTTIEFTMLGDFNKEKALLSSQNTIALEVFRGDKLIKEFFNETLVEGDLLEENSKNELSFNLNLSQDNLNLVNGYYTFRIYSLLENFSKVEPYEIDVAYFDDSKYIPAKNDVQQGYMYLTLYFPDNQVMHSIPVSRKIPHTRRTINATIENLYLGPNSSLGLSQGSPIPKINGLWINNKTAVINLPSDLGAYDQGSASSQSTLSSFVNSITSIFGVDAVKFLENGREVDDMFHGTYVKDPFQRDNSPKAYLGYRGNSSRVLLAPISLETYGSSSSTKEALVEEIFDILKTTSINDYPFEDLIPTIAPNVDLISFEIVGRTLVLNFNDEFISAYENHEDFQHMMLDSILYSFTSIADINRISIKVEGEALKDLNGIILSEEMTPPSYINIEE